MSLILANIIGYVMAHWRQFAIGAGVLVLAILIIVTFKSCTKPKVKLNEVEIQQISDAINTRNRERQEQIAAEIAAKQAVLDAKNAGIDADVKAVKEMVETAKEEAREEVAGMTNEELRLYLEGMK